MTSPIPPTVEVSPATIPVSSPNQYNPQDLTLTIKNQTAVSYDLSGGLRISLPVDPGGGGTASEDALVLTQASLDPNGAATPVVTITATSLTPDSWQITPDTASGPCTFLAQPTGNGTIEPEGNIGFTFSQVVADLVTGAPNITVTILPAIPGQPSLVLYVSVSKIATTLSATIRAGSNGLTMPDNTTQLIWQTTDADSCQLNWNPQAAIVAYNNEQYYGSWTANVPTQFADDAPLPVATIYQQNAASFTLTAYGQGTSVTAPTPTITLATPRLTALTIPPLVTGVTPPSGNPGGGQPVTITGTGLYGTNATVTVLFGSASATSVVVSPNGGVVTATAPPGTGTVPVTVVTPAGSSPATPVASYTYATAGLPAVTGINPPGGDAGGQSQVTITGTGLAGANAVKFGGVDAGQPAVNPDGSITVIAPAGTLGAGAGTSTVPVTVTTDAGDSPPSPAAQYTYVAAGVPAVFGVAQAGAGDPYGGQSPVTITGINLGAVTSLSFGHAQTSTNFTVDSTGTTILATAPPVSAADDIGSTYCTAVDITVTVPGGTTGPVVSAATPTDHYTYATTATAVAPNQPFQLIWSCYTGTGPTLQWTETENYAPIVDAVKVTVDGETFSSGGPIAVSGSALVSSNAPVTFQLQVGTPGGPVPDLVRVGMEPFAFTQFTSAQVAVAANGKQSVLLEWTAQNATGFVLNGGGISNLILPFDQRSYPVPNPPTAPSPLTAPTVFYLDAYGFGQQPGGPVEQPVAQYRPCTVTPVPAAITSFTISALHIPPSSTSITVDPYQAVTLNWSAHAATGYTLAALGPAQSLGVGTTSATDTPSQSTIYLLTALGYTPSGQPPTARVEAVVYHKPPKEQVAAQEKLPNGREKEPPDYPKVVLAHGTVPGPGDLADPEPEPPGGSLQAFVTPGERPDVVPPAEARTEPPAAGPA
jgi:hypothetical protein